MADNRVNKSLKYPPVWVSALIFLVVALVAGYWFNVGPVIWLVALGGAAGILAAGNRNKTSRS